MQKSSSSREAEPATGPENCQECPQGCAFDFFTWIVEPRCGKTAFDFFQQILSLEKETLSFSGGTFFRQKLMRVLLGAFDAPVLLMFVGL